jgi:hypothetical protein
LAAASDHRATVGGNAGSPDGAGAAGADRAGLALVVPGGHPAAGLDPPWGSFCADAVGRTARLLAYPTGRRGRSAVRLLLKFPPGGSATLGPDGDSLGALIEVVDFASWWRS